MKQVLQDLSTGKTQVVDVPVPSPQPGMALVRTAASLVSAGTERTLVEFAEKSLLGKVRARPDLARQLIDKARREGLLTTLETARSRLAEPLPLGYSSAGTVEMVGEGLSNIQVGQRVACAGGGYAVHAEYALVPQNLMAAVPAGVPFEQAAFATLGAIALHGFRLAECQLGDQVAVIGLGLLGQLMVRIASAAGCRVLGVDISEARVEMAVQPGVEAVVRPEAEDRAHHFSKNRGCDAVLICAATTSNDAVELAGTIARDRARVIAVGAVGMEIPRKPYFEKELSFMVSRSYGPGRYDSAYEEKGQDYPIGYVRWTEGRNLEAFIELIAGGRISVDGLITHRFPIDQAEAAYNLVTGKQSEPYLGVLLTYPAYDEALPAVPGDLEAVNNRVTGSSVPARAKPLGIGVIGAGNFARAVALPALRELSAVKLVGIASASGLHAQDACRRFGFAYAESDAGRILADPNVDIAAILTRHDLHAGMVLEALEAGKHVFCEKPLAIGEDELLQVETALQSSGSNGPLLTVGFNRRFAPLAQKLFDFIGTAQQPVLAIYRVNAGYLPPDHWLHDPAVGGGRIVGESCHFIDFIAALVGLPPDRVSAAALPDEGRYRGDNAVIQLSFPDGSLGTVLYAANGDRAQSKERVEVYSGGRVAVLDDFRQLELYKDGRRRVEKSRLRQDKGHRQIWEAFIAAVGRGGPPPIPYAHLIGVSKAAFAALESIRSAQEIHINGQAPPSAL